MADSREAVQIHGSADFDLVRRFRAGLEVNGDGASYIFVHILNLADFLAPT